MPYHKDKQQAFQAAQQGTKQAVDAMKNLVVNDADYASHVKHLRQEVEEAQQQIQNALEVASETQRMQLQQYDSQVQQIMQAINDYDAMQ